jgi:GDP/UDP-N,N'-diacetylbacillosamine 2-epimerase (hydrolysing)
MKKRVAVLTSSRADFGIYLPLLKALVRDIFFDLEIIAFGTHLSKRHGYTLSGIENEGFKAKFKIETVPESDDPAAISTSMGSTMIKFSSFWELHACRYDLVFCLGDRFEMFAAVMAGVPFQVKFAHIHGGEQTLGAIDNVFRHSISHASTIHFTSTPHYRKRLKQMVDDCRHIYHTGSLSLGNIDDIPLFNIKDFQVKWKIDLRNKTILTTFHPETVNADRNLHFAEEIVKAVTSITEYQFLITMPNADTSGNTVRKIFEKNLLQLEHVRIIENLGTKGYFSAMKYCSLMLGNTSSGIIESASFGKYVINLGDRQKGRACNSNVVNVPINSEAILLSIKQLIGQEYKGENIYYKAGAANRIISSLKNDFFS